MLTYLLIIVTLVAVTVALLMIYDNHSEKGLVLGVIAVAAIWAIGTGPAVLGASIATIAYLLD